MCLAVPARIVRMESPNEALCDFGGVQKHVDTTLVSDAKENDWVYTLALRLKKSTKRRRKKRLHS